MFSDPPPACVVPNGEGMGFIRGESYEGPYSVCNHYAPHEGIIAWAAKDGRYTVHECKSRSPYGERRYSWCYRCPAGFMFSLTHIYDSGLARDRAITVV